MFLIIGRQPYIRKLFLTFIPERSGMLVKVESCIIWRMGSVNRLSEETIKNLVLSKHRLSRKRVKSVLVPIIGSLLDTEMKACDNEHPIRGGM